MYVVRITQKSGAVSYVGAYAPDSDDAPDSHLIVHSVSLARRETRECATLTMQFLQRLYAEWAQYGADYQQTVDIVEVVTAQDASRLFDEGASLGADSNDE